MKYKILKPFGDYKVGDVIATAKVPELPIRNEAGEVETLTGKDAAEIHIRRSVLKEISEAEAEKKSSTKKKSKPRSKKSVKKKPKAK